MPTSIRLPKLPKNEYYEDLVAALMCLGGNYVERRISMVKPTNVLELDLVTYRFSQTDVDVSLSEIKSGEWGFPDIFKVRGWLDLLKYQHAIFVTLNSTDENFETKKQIAEKLNILLSNINIIEGNVDRKEFARQLNMDIPEDRLRDCALSSLRYAFCLERIMHEKYLTPMAKNPAIPSASLVKQYYENVVEHSFFCEDTVSRMRQVFSTSYASQRLTAIVADSLASEDHKINPGVTLIKENCFKTLFFEVPADKNLLHIAQFAELTCRLAMMKLCIEEMIRFERLDNISSLADQFSIPPMMFDGMQKMKQHRYFYLYPHFWQIFIFVFGGFIMLNKKEEEYSALSALTNIPVEEIDNALNAWDVLFTRDNSWLRQRNNTDLLVLDMIPFQISGLGANFRRQYYGSEKDASYNYLGTQVKSKYTITDLIKFNNLSVAYFELDKNITFNTEE